VRDTAHVASTGFISPEPGLERNAEVDELVVLARRLQAAHQLQADADFAWQLERRLFRRHAELQRKQTNAKRSGFSLFRAHPVFGAMLGLCPLFLLLSSGVLALASLDLQFARDRLTTLSSLADPVHTEVYLQALSELDQQLNSAASAINGLPPGSQHNQVANELIGLQSDTIRVLRDLLARLALPGRLATTDELAGLGASVPHLISGTLTLPAHSTGHATISIAGNGIQPGAQLLVDGKPSGVTGTLPNTAPESPCD